MKDFSFPDQKVVDGKLMTCLLKEAAYSNSQCAETRNYLERQAREFQSTYRYTRILSQYVGVTRVNGNHVCRTDYALYVFGVRSANP